MRMKDYKIYDNEILVDSIFINEEEFVRYYYHKNNIPTRYFVSRSGYVYSEITNRILKTAINRGGYKYISMQIYPKEKKKTKTMQVHNMVAAVFCGGYKKKMHIDHIDGNKLNNNSSNLEWVTASINAKRAYDNGLHKKITGMDNHLTKYSDKEIHKVCKMLSKGIRPKFISKKTGISVSNIQLIKQNKNRSDISKQYTFPTELFMGKNNPLDEKTKLEIRKLYERKIPLKEIQKILNIDSYYKLLHAIYDK